MKRPAWLTASAVVLALGSLLQVVMALLIVAAAEIKPRHGLSQTGHAAGALPPPPAWMPYLTSGAAALFLGLAVWGIVTAIGLHRLRSWARNSLLAIGSGMALIGFFSMLAMLLLLFIPLPAGPGVDPSHAHAVQIGIKIVFISTGLFFAAVLAIGVWWLVYFNLQDVRGLFVNAQGEVEESHRPPLISIIAVLSFIGSASFLISMSLPTPAAFFGSLLFGWEKIADYAVYAALEAAAGIGLWRLMEPARRLKLFLLAAGFVNSAIYLLSPPLRLRVAALHPVQGNPYAPLSESFQKIFVTGAFGLTAVFMVAVAVILHHYRAKFCEPAEPTALAASLPESGVQPG